MSGGAPGRIDAKYTFNPPTDFAKLIPELEQQPSDYTVTKRTIGAFYDTDLEGILRRCEVTQVFIVGISTSSGVEATARAAYDHGYNVVPVVDAMTDPSGDAHKYSVERIFPRIGETTTASALLKLMANRTPAGLASFAHKSGTDR